MNLAVTYYTEMHHLHKVIQDNHHPVQFFQEGKPQQKINGKPNPSIGKFVGARAVIPCIKGLSEQCMHKLAEHTVLVYSKHPILDAQKTDIIYHWKCPANTYTAKYIGEITRSLKERVSDHRNQTTSAIRNHHISTKNSKAELKRFHNNRQRQQHPTSSSKRSTSHLH